MYIIYTGIIYYSNIYRGIMHQCAHISRIILEYMCVPPFFVHTLYFVL